MIYYVIMKRKSDGKEFNTGFYMHKRNAEKFIARTSVSSTSTYRIIEAEKLLKKSEMDAFMEATAP